MVAHLTKWGNSVGVRLPKVFLEDVGLRDGSTVEVAVENGRIVITPCAQRPCLGDLIDGITKDNLHAAVDEGASVGREVW